MKNAFTIKFRGVRGSYPKADKNFLDFGGNTSSVELRCGKQLIIIDAGTGIIDIGQDVTKEIKDKEKQAHCATIFLSHIHQDHIQGLPFYKPLFNPLSKINLFGLNTPKEDLKDSLKTFLFDKAFPLGLDEIKSDFKIYNFAENNIVVIKQNSNTKLYNKGDSISFDNDDIVVSSFKSSSHPKYGCLCIKVQYNSKTFVYSTDRESYKYKTDENGNNVCFSDKGFIDFAKNCDILVHDAQYTDEDYLSSIHPKQGFGHSTFKMAIEALILSNAKKLYFFHYDPDYNDEKLKKLEEKLCIDKKIYFAKENLEIEL